MVSTKFLLLLAFGILEVVQAQNYCSRSLCGRGRHIACRNNGQFAASCPRNAAMVNIKPHMQTILNEHNTRRNKIAGGGLRGYRPARRMATMQWDEELAKLARLNVRQCVMRHDSCRNTNKFRSSGQNLAFFSYTGRKSNMKPAEIIRSSIKNWWDEYKVARMSYINRYPSNYNGPQIGHFTVMAADRNIRVGCGASQFKKGGRNNFLFACNYATTNIIGNPIYAAGTTASGCRRGRNRNYRNLCSSNEYYDVNNI